MKKIFTLLLAAAACMTATATDLQLLFGAKDNLQPTVEGQSYQTGYEETVPGAMYSQNSDLYLKGLEGEEVTVEVKASAEVQFCGLTQQCTNGTSFTRTANMSEATNKVAEADGYITIDLKIDANYFSVEEISEITVEVTAYYNDTPDDKVTAKVVMTNKPASEIGGISVMGAETYFIKASAGNVINYSLERPATISLYAITGNLVSKYSVQGTGSINLNGLTRGIYLFTDGRRSGKIIVR